MAEVPKNLGQVRPAAETLTPGYTVPATKRAVLSTIVVCNLGVKVERFRVSHAILGVADALAQYLYYDEVIPGSKTFTITLGICAQAGDIIRVQSEEGMLAFNIYGVEV